jgi:hypothetical protein
MMVRHPSWSMSVSLRRSDSRFSSKIFTLQQIKDEPRAHPCTSTKPEISPCSLLQYEVQVLAVTLDPTRTVLSYYSLRPSLRYE